MGDEEEEEEEEEKEGGEEEEEEEVEEEEEEDEEEEEIQRLSSACSQQSACLVVPQVVELHPARGSGAARELLVVHALQQGRTLVHFSAQPELFPSMKPTQRIAQKVLTLR